ncbi:MAG: HAD hydrolase-like protein [Acidobacteriia bacterium]|nr:HAD hydrolase-like protein [Terriglobia bacterium]
MTTETATSLFFNGRSSRPGGPMLRALVFDLDDTLYCERDFLASGFRAVAEHLSATCGRPRDEIHQMMMATLAREGRRSVMPAVLARFPDSGFQVADLVSIYRSHTPQIRLFTGYDGLLKELRARYRLGIVTDGAPDVQKAKCAALGLEGAVDSIIYTWEYGLEKEKPHPFPFRLMLRCLQAPPDEALFIGDSLEKDCRGARGVGMKCVRVQQPPIIWGAESGEEADFVIESLLQLPLVLRQLEGPDEPA